MNDETQTVPEDRGKKRERRETEIRLYQQSQWDAEDRSATLPARPKHPRKKKSAINPPADLRSA